MKYDFTSIMNRRGMDALAVDGIDHMVPGAVVDPGFDVIPMSVADMNFPTVPTVPAAIIARAQHPAYGYFIPREEYYEAITRWQTRRNGAVGLTKEHICYENGVLGGVVSALNVFCSKGDKVLVHSPTYVGFTGSLTNNGYRIVHSPLRQDSQGVWRMDFEDMERKLTEQHIHAAILCSPHNPCGRVWERWELEQAMELFRKHGVWVVSDEIWSDILLRGNRHIPTQSVSEDARNRTVALYAPSKTFNLAGLVGSYHIAYNPWLRDRLEKETSLSHYNSMNVLSMHALMAAYSPEGEQWVEELCQTLTGNIDFACDYIKAHFEGVEVFRPQGTYMLFLDCGKWCRAHGKTPEELLLAGARVGVIWQSGAGFQAPDHIRMNLALPLSRVEEAFRRLDRYVFNPPKEAEASL
ncbi:MAG: aminotransferase class I/II-fold pyridoxal phosphate-dependent enzyme [Candidatus Faecousia sp.]|nr:aminotransferase class I/II-fold pyridoxal phosphate-dependent enzyme [Candidatus Faecousia sp.]